MPKVEAASYASQDALIVQGIAGPGMSGAETSVSLVRQQRLLGISGATAATFHQR